MRKLSLILAAVIAAGTAVTLTGCGGADDAPVKAIFKMMETPSVSNVEKFLEYYADYSLEGDWGDYFEEEEAYLEPYGDCLFEICYNYCDENYELFEDVESIYDCPTLDISYKIKKEKELPGSMIEELEEYWECVIDKAYELTIEVTCEGVEEDDFELTIFETDGDWYIDTDLF